MAAEARRPRMSIRNSSACSSPMRISVSGSIVGSIPIALARAAVQFVSHGRIVSGASTLSMQVARLIEPREGRSLTAKFQQLARALQIERRLSKAGNSRPLSDACALWRQSGRHPRCKPCLFRQGAAPPDRSAIRIARCTAATAGKAQARSQSGSGRNRRVAACCSAWR